jgi:hypothetical protein
MLSTLQILTASVNCFEQHPSFGAIFPSDRRANTAPALYGLAAPDGVNLLPVHDLQAM